jgi:hypothetical protein
MDILTTWALALRAQFLIVKSATAFQANAQLASMENTACQAVRLVVELPTARAAQMELLLGALTACLGTTKT